MNNLTFGRYSPFNTVVHRLDPRNKIFIMVLLMVCIFLRVTSWSSTLIISGVLFLFLLLVMIITRVSFLSLLKSIGAMWFLLLFLIVIYVFVPNPQYNPTHIAFRINDYPINYDAFYQCGYIFIRLIMMLMITMILTSSTKPMDLTYGLEWYLTPLKVVKFPSHIVAMTLSIALRFIPTLIDETNRIIKAQASRGVDFNHGGPFKRFRAIFSLIIPLFVSAITRSEELSDAMEARGYDPYAKRSRYRVLRFHFSDLVALLLGLILFGGILTLVVLDKCVPEFYQQVNLIKWIFNIDPLF